MDRHIDHLGKHGVVYVSIVFFKKNAKNLADSVLD